MKPKITDAAKGKWPAILQKLGIEERFLVNRHGPCPVCGGKDRFRFDDKGGRGTWFCTQCGSGDGIELLKRVHGWEFKQAAREVEQHVGTAAPIPIRHGRTAEQVKTEMNAIWASGVRLCDVPEAEAWWYARLGELPVCADLRAHHALRCPGHDKYPAMVALVRDSDGKPVNLHRTFLGTGGSKADIAEPRRVMDTTLPKGCAVRLSAHASKIGVAEGIETAAACQKLFDVPTWALLNAQNLSGWTPPPGVSEVVIYGDNDRSLTGHWASYTLARRLIGAGPWRVEVKIPERIGWDWNDVLQHDREAALKLVAG